MPGSKVEPPKKKRITLDLSYDLYCSLMEATKKEMNTPELQRGDLQTAIRRGIVQFINTAGSDVGSTDFQRKMELLKKALKNQPDQLTRTQIIELINKTLKVADPRSEKKYMVKAISSGLLQPGYYSLAENNFVFINNSQNPINDEEGHEHETEGI